MFGRTTSYCVQCVATKRALDSKCIAYGAKVIEDQPDEQLQAHEDAGRIMAPSIEVEYAPGRSLAWSGNRPDFNDKLEVK